MLFDDASGDGWVARVACVRARDVCESFLTVSAAAGHSRVSVIVAVCPSANKRGAVDGRPVWPSRSDTIRGGRSASSV